LSVIVVALVLVSGCSHGDDRTTSYAEVDCARMTDHLIDVMVSDRAAALTASEVQHEHAQLDAQRDSLIAGCVQDQPTRHLTERQYACLLAAETTEAMSHCQ
jgi:hypothetical protein